LQFKDCNRGHHPKMQRMHHCPCIQLIHDQLQLSGMPSAPLVSIPGVQHYSDSGLIWLIIKVYSFLWRYHWRRWTLVCLFMLYCDRSRCVKWLRNLVIFLGWNFLTLCCSFVPWAIQDPLEDSSCSVLEMGCSFFK